MNVEFTPAFLKHTKEIIAKANKNSMIIKTKKVGCNGLAYDFVPNSCDIGDLIEGENGNVNISLFCDFAIIISLSDKQIFNNCKFDYIRDGLNYKIEVTNPQKTSECGCGHSFNVL